MRDGGVILVVCIVLIGSVGWLILRANGVTPFTGPTVVVQATDEAPKEEPAPPPPPSKPVVKPRVEVAVAAIPPLPPVPPEPVRAVVPAPPPTRPYPSLLQIKKGVEKGNITAMYGDPSLSATTGSHGHTFDTFVYNRERGDSITIIRFEDGRVYAARATP